MRRAAPLDAADPNPTNDEASAVDAARGLKEQDMEELHHYLQDPGVQQVMQAIKGERKAEAYLACLREKRAPAQALAATVASMQGPELRGFCRIIDYAMQGAHMPDVPQALQVSEREQQRFAQLSKQFAANGHALMRSNTADRSAPFYAVCWGYKRPLASLRAAASLLRKVGGPP